MNSEDNEKGRGGAVPPGAVSIYGQDAMDDFPVLRAFQKYIDAEQSKAHKRMTTLCLFFALVLTLVVAVFVVLLVSVGKRDNALNDQLMQRNNELHDQLVQYMMKERDRPQVAAQPNDATIKAISETMSAFQKQMSEQQFRMAEQQTKILEQQARAAEERAKRAEALSPANTVMEQAEKNRADEAKIQKAVALLKAEREKLAKEHEKLAKDKEAVRQREIELQRRKLYPEYYARQDAEKSAAKPAAEKPQAKKPAAAKPAAPAKRPAPQVADDLRPLDELDMAEAELDLAVRLGDDDDDIDAMLGLDPLPGKPGINHITMPETPAPAPAPATKPIAPTSAPATMPKTPAPAVGSVGADGWEVPLE